MPIFEQNASFSGEDFSGSYMHSNPMFDFLSGFAPRNLKDLFKWAEYIFTDSPHISATVEKLALYSITEIRYLSEQPATVAKLRSVLEDDVGIYPAIRTVRRDGMIYGNSFTSLYMPFKRLAKCKNADCNLIHSLDHLKYKYDSDKLTFSYVCPGCRESCVTHLDDIKDVPIKDAKRIKIIRWDPKQITLDDDPITGQVDVYYKLHARLIEKIKKGSSIVINGIPPGFLRCVAKNEDFKFNRNEVFHLRNDPPAGLDTPWGIPPVTSVLKQFYYTAVLRKANEAIALDHVVPFRVLHPAQVSGSSDPIVNLNGSDWVRNTREEIKKWRRDPLHIMFSPTALGVTQMGGQGRSLMTLGEIQAAEENILAGLKVPREFIMGGLSVQVSPTALRMLENQLLAENHDSNRLLQWVVDKITRFMGYAKTKTSLTPFKFVDDAQQKALLLEMNAQYKLLSRQFIGEIFSIDTEEQDKARREEELREAKTALEHKRKLEDIENSLSAQATQMAQQQQMGPGLAYDQQMVVGKADEVAQGLLQLPEGDRRSQLSDLQATDYVMYAVVIQRMEQLRVEQGRSGQAPM
ncbi:MAG: hypothetical protein E6R03_01485 [Hyphomicrobiaceae bacterium]|nr:MAG: hypothetical protein E6R03_01485 [Hyphomicrobiaceae bacterium]